MSARIASLVAELGAACGTTLAPGEVLRLDLGREGELVAALERDRVPSWWLRREGTWRALDPREDARLAVARRLADAGPVELLAWRPGRRMTLRLGEAGGGVLKGHRRGRAQAAARAHRAAQQVSAASGLGVPELLGCDEAEASLRFEDVGGERLELGARAAPAMYRVGHALRRVQEAPPPEGLPLHDRAAELEVLATWRARVVALEGAPPAGWEAAHERLVAHAAPRVSRRAVTVHRDLHDGQLLATPRGLYWIDFDLLALGDEALDAANLSVHLHLRAQQGLFGATPEHADAAAEALLDGLDRDDPGFLESLRFHQASAALRLALVYSLRPRWRRVVQPLVTLARRCVDELPFA